MNVCHSGDFRSALDELGNGRRDGATSKATWVVTFEVRSEFRGIPQQVVAFAAVGVPARFRSTAAKLVVEALS
jgi:hypothetical protein